MTAGLYDEERTVSQMEQSPRVEICDTRISRSEEPVGGDQHAISGNDSFKRNAMNSALLDFYLCPEELGDFEVAGELSDEVGYFLCGQNAICFGRSASGYRASRPDIPLYDTLADIGIHQAKAVFPFDPTEVIDSLRLERYANRGQGALSEWEESLKAIYYFFRPFLWAKLRRQLQRSRLIGWRSLSFPALAGRHDS